MKFYKKVLPLLALTGIVLAGCGAQQHHASHQSSEQTASRSMTHKDQVKHELKNNEHGAKQQSYGSQNQAKQSIQHKVNQQPAAQATNSSASTNSSSSSSASQEPGAVDLGHGITGHQDRGAGQTYVSFKMGRWQVVVHGNDVNEKASTTVQKAKQLVGYFQDHTLPIPSSQGIVQLDAPDNSIHISWDQNKKVNTLNGDPSNTLQKAVSLK